MVPWRRWSFCKKTLAGAFCANPLLRRSPLKMNIKHIIFFDIKIETKQKKKKLEKKRGKLKVKEKQYWKQKIPTHSNDHNRCDSLKNGKNEKKWWKRKKPLKNHKKNCKTNLKIKTKNRSTPIKLRKDLKNPQSIRWRKKNTNTIVFGSKKKERKMKQKSSPIAPQVSARERKKWVQFVVLVWVLWFKYVRNLRAASAGIATVIIRRSFWLLAWPFLSSF